MINCAMYDVGQGVGTCLFKKYWAVNCFTVQWGVKKLNLILLENEKWVKNKVSFWKLRGRHIIKNFSLKIYFQKFKN
jgi:hypothetical protein